MAAALKVVAIIIALCVLSTAIPVTGGQEGSAGTTAVTTTFSKPVMVNNNKVNDQAAPVSIIAAGQGLFVVWQDARSGDEDIYTSVSFDGGTTFPTNKRADDAVSLSRQIEPSTAVSGNGTVMIVWQDNRRGTFDYDIFFTKSYDDGSKYTPNLRVDDSTSGLSWQERPAIAVTLGGAVCVAWTDDRTGQLRVRYAYSENGGDTFSASREIVSSGDVGGQTGVALASSGNRVFAAFLDNVSGKPSPYLSISSDGGKTFSTPKRLDNTGNSGAVQRGLSMAAMPGGGIVVAWEDSRNGEWDIYASILSADGSAVFSNIRVDDDSSGSYQRDPCVATDQLGNVYAVWEDDRNSKFAIRFAYLESNRNRFSASMEVAAPGSDDMQRRPSVIAPKPGRAVVIWQDDKSGTYDVYSSTAYFSSLFGLSLVKGWNFVSIPTTGFDYRASTLGLRYGDAVFGWNSTTQTYDQIYVVGKSPPAKDFAIRQSTGYLICAVDDERILLNGTVPTSVQQRQIVVPAEGGWFFLGLESLNTTTFASDIRGMYSGGVVRQVIAYTPVTGTYRTYNPLGPFTDFPLAPGQACWVSVSASGTLTYSP